MKDQPDIKNLTFEECQAWCLRQGFPAYRAQQLFVWLYRKRARDFAAMTDVPQEMQRRLAETFSHAWPAVHTRSRAPDGTVKFLLEYGDGAFVETVSIPAIGRVTQCVSTQVGCKFGCRFCASGAAGFRRDLTAAEIVGQVLLVQEALAPRQTTHLVIMGMGEPFDNYEALLKALKIVNCPWGLGIGARRITVSTVGLVPAIHRFAKEGRQFELSISLHAPDDETRGGLMPINRRYPVREIIAAARAYTAATKRIITFEYLLIHDVTDTPRQAQLLVELLRGLDCKVNLIPLNPVGEFAAQAPTVTQVRRFARALRRQEINATIRKPRGRKIDAACGQLRLRTELTAKALNAAKAQSFAP